MFEEPVIQVFARGLYVSGDRRCSVKEERRHDRSPSDFVVFNPEDKTVSIILIEVNSCATASESAEEIAEPRNHWIDRLRSRFPQNDLGGDWLYRVRCLPKGGLRQAKNEVWAACQCPIDQSRGSLARKRAVPRVRKQNHGHFGSPCADISAERSRLAT